MISEEKRKDIVEIFKQYAEDNYDKMTELLYNCDDLISITFENMYNVLRSGCGISIGDYKTAFEIYHGIVMQFMKRQH